MGQGIIGGMITSGLDQGRTAAEIAIKILNGLTPSQIPVIQDSPNRYIFDYLQLERFGLDMERLPQNHTLINDPVDYFIERYHTAIIIALVALLCQSAIIFVLIVNIMRRKQAEKELDEYRKHLEGLVEKRTAQLAVAKQQAEAANAAKSDFLARMSHDIRTPLNAVTGLTNIVLKTDLKDEQRDYLNKVQIASNTLLEVINDVLDFSKVEAGLLKLSRAPFDLDQVMEQQADLFSDQVAQKNLELIFDIAPQVPRQLIGDAGRLTQVLTNLIGNAVKFTDQGEIVVSVDLDDAASKEHAQAALKFSVCDTGVGIAADVLPILFDPFTQADGSLTRRHEGTGLGLAICWQLANLMGGRIWAESTPGKGSTFSFTAMLEISMKQPEAMAPRRPQEPTARPTPHLTGRRVLVVEDSELNRDVAVALLAEAGVEVDIAENGQVAVEKVTKSPRGYYDAVLMDIQMPVMDGYAATREIRNSKFEIRNIPIIALTAHALKGEKEKCLEVGMDDYLNKPLDEQDLHRVLLKWIASQLTESSSEASRPSNPPSLDRPAVSDTTAVFDVQGVLKRLGDRKNIYVKILKTFEQECGKAAETIRQCLTGGDMETAERTAHVVKGAASNIGATALFDEAANLEKAIFDKGPEIDSCFERFKKELYNALEAASEFLEMEQKR